MKIKDFQASKPQKFSIFGSRKSIKDFQGFENFDSFKNQKILDSHRKYNFRDHQKHKVFEIIKFLKIKEKI